MRRILPVLAALTLAAPAAAIDHSGTASGTWLAADSPHRVLDSVSVPAGETLVIEGGATVVFLPAARLHVDGALNVRGRSDAPVLMGSAGSGVPGEWKGLVLTGAGPHLIAHADIAHAGTGIQVAPGVTLDLRDTSVSRCEGDGVAFMGPASGSILRCTFSDNGTSGLALLDASPTVTDCRFTGNQRAAWLSGAAFPRMSGLSASGNAVGDGVLLDASRPVGGRGTWTGSGLPFLVATGQTLTIDAGSEVTMAPGAVVKMGQGAGLRVAGSLASFGVGSVITSMRDDSVLGDSNGDGASSTPGKGDWDAVEVVDGGVAHLTGMSLRHADDAVRVVGGDAFLLACDVREAANRGAGFGPGARGYVEGTSFTDCEIGLQVADATAVIAGLPGTGGGLGGRNSFGCNASWDVRNEDTATLQVHRSFFGTTGPDWTRLSGDIDVGTPMPEEPGVVVANVVLRLARPDAASVTFGRGSAGSCARYRLASSPTPDGSFGTLAWSDSPAVTLPVASLPAGPVVFFELTMER